jgi:hypothetical protein
MPQLDPHQIHLPSAQAELSPIWVLVALYSSVPQTFFLQIPSNFKK